MGKVIKKFFECPHEIKNANKVGFVSFILKQINMFVINIMTRTMNSKLRGFHSRSHEQNM